MSDTAQGPGWWMASDGKWYPPELWTGPPNTGPPPTTSPVMGAPQPATPTQPGQVPAYGGVAIPGQPTYTGAPYGTYEQSSRQPGTYAPYGQPMATYGLPVKTNGLAIASLVCSCAGLLVLPLVVGVVLGFVARAQIKRSNGTQRGDGMAIAGIIIGFGWAALIILGIILNATTNPNSTSVIDTIGLLGLIR